MIYSATDQRKLQSQRIYLEGLQVERDRGWIKVA